MKNTYQWQGETAKIRFGNCVVKSNNEKPLYWYNYECNLGSNLETACIPAIEVTTSNGNTFVLANHFGIGVHKLINGGWPSHTHFSLNGEFSTKPRLRYSEFDLTGYEGHEAARNKWQSKNFPIEFKKMEALRAMTKRK